MLLPSDVARLVLGYLQEEGLSATSQSFIQESPNLKEYADHTIGDGTVPACVFSVFGKGLTTILNEYMATKTKESFHEVPAVMTSLWKKLDFTLNQIKSLQSSRTVSACQRTRSRVGVANMTRQRALTFASAGSVVSSSVSESTIISPAQLSHRMFSHSTPVSQSAEHNQPAVGSGTHQQILDVRLNTPMDSLVQAIVSENKQNPGPMSPGRRKWDTPRKRGGAVCGSSGPGRCATNPGGLSAEAQLEQAVDENFPKLVIQNARDKILGDRSLQEKLAENINKILASDPVPQTSKSSSSTLEAEQSIDEILGLQGEIHMTDDAIHDILEQTESDPAFQALYDLFDYNKARFTDEVAEGINSIPEESVTAGHSSEVRPFQTDDPGVTQKDPNPSGITSVKTKTSQERKTRKSTASTLLRKTTHDPSGKASRLQNCSARLLVSPKEHQGGSSLPVPLAREGKASLLNNSGFVTPMDTEEPLNTPPPPSDSMINLETSSKDNTSTTSASAESTTVPSSKASAASVVPDMTGEQKCKQSQISKGQPSAAPFTQSHQPALFSPVPFELNNATMPTADLPQMSIPSSGGETQPLLTLSATSESGPHTCVSNATPFTTPCSLASGSTSATRTSSTSTLPAHSTSFVQAGAAPAVPNTNHTTLSKAATDSNVVSLKIIISDNHDEDSSSDPVLKQAISSISGDNIPTIYLSSPAKSLEIPGTPKANLDEVAQAVSSLQSSEVHASPLGSKAGALVASPLPGTSQVQQNYIIQLPLDTTTPTVPGAAASYFLVTEPPTKDIQCKPMVLPAGVSKGQPLPFHQYGVPSPSTAQGFSTGSALILPSPAKTMMIPVSVMGQNTLRKVPVVSNQIVAIHNAGPVQNSEIFMPKPPSVAIKVVTTTGTEQHPVVTGQQDTAKGLKHKRILCFDSSKEVQPQTQQTPIDDTRLITRTKPTILGGNKPKRRVQTVRSSADPRTDRGFVKETEKLLPTQQRQKDNVKKMSRKQDHTPHNQLSLGESTSRVDASEPETMKKSELERRSKSIERKQRQDKDGGGEKARHSHRSRSLPSDSALKEGTKKEKEESSKKELEEKAPAKSREGRTEKRTLLQETPNVTANKENEIKSSTSSAAAARDFNPPAVTPQPSNPQSKATKAPSKTSSLAKQAAEMLHDFQGLNSPPTPVKRPTEGSSVPTLPRIAGPSCNQEGSSDSPRTPSQQKKVKDGEGTPKNLMLPNTSDVPTCSPVSEAGSESSINMAAHTLMILSRAAIARTGTPLKDSLRQEGVEEKSPVRSKNSKKRKLSSPSVSPPAKKDRERKKLIDCFPHDLDVDKFLSSLHYDE